MDGVSVTSILSPRRLTAVRYDTLQAVADKQGTLLKRGHIKKSWKRRWFVLADGKLHYFPSQALTGKALGVIDLTGYVAEVFEDVNLSTEWNLEGVTFFRLIHPTKPIYDLCADQEEELQQWLQAILFEIHKQRLQIVEVNNGMEELPPVMEGEEDDDNAWEECRERLQARKSVKSANTVHGVHYSIGASPKESVEKEKRATIHTTSSPSGARRGLADKSRSSFLRSSIFGRKSAMLSDESQSPQSSPRESISRSASASSDEEAATIDADRLRLSAELSPPPSPSSQAQKLQTPSEPDEIGDERLWSSGRLQGILMAFSVLSREVKDAEVETNESIRLENITALKKRIENIRPQLLICMQEHPQVFRAKAIVAKYNTLVDKLFQDESEQQQRELLRLDTSGSTICSSCTLPLQGKAVELAGKRYHKTCFICTGCNIQLTASCISIREQAYCEQCGRTAFTRLRMQGASGKTLRAASPPPASSPPRPSASTVLHTIPPKPLPPVPSST